MSKKDFKELVRDNGISGVETDRPPNNEIDSYYTKDKSYHPVKDLLPHWSDDRRSDFKSPEVKD